MAAWCTNPNHYFDCTVRPSLSGSTSAIFVAPNAALTQRWDAIYVPVRRRSSEHGGIDQLTFSMPVRDHVEITPRDIKLQSAQTTGWRMAG
jgi:hypothetical protein